MQSYLQTYRARYDVQTDVDYFWVKVHQAGEIPWMGRNPSSWEKIQAHEEEMSTVFINIQGEKVDNKVDYFFMKYTFHFINLISGVIQKNISTFKGMSISR